MLIPGLALHLNLECTLELINSYFSLFLFSHSSPIPHSPFFFSPPFLPHRPFLSVLLPPSPSSSLQSMVLLLHSQRQYIFDYDLSDRLSAVTMPSVARHTMQTIRSLGYYRNIYNPPESNASVTVDYSEDGQLLRVAHLGTG